MPKQTRKPCIQQKFATVMREYARGSLHSGRGGGLAKSRAQAKAIAYSEARKKCARKTK